MLKSQDSINPIILKSNDLKFPRIEEPPDGIITVRDVWLYPGCSGLYSSTGLPIIESFLRRGFDLCYFPHGRPQAINIEASTSKAQIAELASVVYLPHAGMEHFGHLLTEFAAYVGPLLDNSTGVDRIAGTESFLVVPPRFAPCLRRLAELLSLPMSRVFSTASLIKPVHVRQAFIPRPSMYNRHGLARRHFYNVRNLLSHLFDIDAELAKLAEPDCGTKLYLSRSCLPPKARHVFDEEVLEQRLKQEGWLIVYPEQISMRKQLEHLRSARTIAGSIGSAFHLLMAFGICCGQRRLITLGQSAVSTNPNVFLQAACQGLQFRHIVCLDHYPASTKKLRFVFHPNKVASWLESLSDDHYW